LFPAPLLNPPPDRCPLNCPALLFEPLFAVPFTGPPRLRLPLVFPPACGRGTNRPPLVAEPEKGCAPLRGAAPATFGVVPRPGIPEPPELCRLDTCAPPRVPTYTEPCLPTTGRANDCDGATVDATRAPPKRLSLVGPTLMLRSGAEPRKACCGTRTALRFTGRPPTRVRCDIAIEPPGARRLA
jgi:hypothetical protein